MQSLNLPEYLFKIRQNDGRKEIFDPIRKKYVALTPEEWVRQHFVQYLINEKSAPATLIAIEQTLTYNTMKRRSDIVVYSGKAMPLILVECKSAEIKLSQKVFDQIARYNMALKVPYLIITNGLTHFCCKIDFHSMAYTFLKDIPDYREIVNS